MGIKDMSPEHRASVIVLMKFNYEKRRAWTIWGAKHQKCETCGQEAGMPCLNMNDLKNKMRYNARTTNQPHTPRIDWVRIHKGLVYRGYIKE